MRAKDVLKPVGTSRPNGGRRELTAKEKKAWAAYVAIAGERSSLQLEGVSLHDVVDAGIAVLHKAALEKPGASAPWAYTLARREIESWNLDKIKAAIGPIARNEERIVASLVAKIAEAMRRLEAGKDGL